MHFFIYCVDKPDHVHVRNETRQAHLDYLGQFKEQFVTLGPTMTDDGETPTGSVLIMEFEDRDAAEAFVADEPYNKAGLFESVTVKRFRKPGG